MRSTVARPRVSVVIPAYNGERFIAEAVQSVYRQSALPDEVLVINDGSTDNTERELRRLGAELPESFRWYSRVNSGGPAAPRNLGITATEGDYIAFLDQDDVWHRAKLERQLEQFAAQPELALSFTGYRFVSDDESRVVRIDDWDPDPAVVLDRLMLSPAAVGPPSTVMMKREVIERVGGFDASVGYSDDWKMWLRVAALSLPMGYLPEPLVDYYWHGENLSTGRSKQLASATRMFDSFFSDRDLPAPIGKRAGRVRAYWYFEAAIDARQRGDLSAARRHALKAAAIRPKSMRPGWIRVLGIGPPP